MPTFMLVCERPANMKPHGQKRKLWYVLEVYDKAPTVASVESSRQRYTKLGYIDVQLYQRVSLRGE